MQAELNAALVGLAAQQRTIPVLTIADVAIAVPLARALAAGGLRLLEVTLRTPASLEAIAAIARSVPDAEVGAGTVLTAAHAKAAIDAGSRFCVSPGATSELLAAAAHWPVALLPGAATASEAMALSERGYRFLKFFPAESSGGVAALKSLAAPLAEIKFCPTGGVTPQNRDTYLGCANVVCVGGSWVAPDRLIAEGRWAEITKLAAAAAAPVMGAGRVT
jgi:2-dehydro-3-deoxyphosphogluconate aldolase / (4S)-4-hydroxy-2-oxoglutarate aldolase